tara:strand:+ start:485 stop:631 length:147 start_codon:yes stop_codon:yes gene_type:complete
MIPACHLSTLEGLAPLATFLFCRAAPAAADSSQAWRLFLRQALAWVRY